MNNFDRNLNQKEVKRKSLLKVLTIIYSPSVPVFVKSVRLSRKTFLLFLAQI